MTKTKMNLKQKKKVKETMGNRRKYIGEKFGRLTVVADIPKENWKS